LFSVLAVRMARFLFVLVLFLLVGAASTGLHSRKNKKGGRYHPGQRDEGVWQEVCLRTQAGQAIVLVATEMRLWPSTVWRITERAAHQDLSAHPRGNAAASVQARKQMKVQIKSHQNQITLSSHN
jgi:hypothetical protein